MNTFLVANGREIPAEFYGKTRDYDWDERETKTIHIEMTHEEAVQFFTDNLVWAIKCVYEPEKEGDEPRIEIFDNSEYKLSGSILDTRDGFVDVKMGKLTSFEQFIEDIYGGVNNVN